MNFTINSSLDCFLLTRMEDQSFNLPSQINTSTDICADLKRLSFAFLRRIPPLGGAGISVRLLLTKRPTPFLFSLHTGISFFCQKPDQAPVVFGPAVGPQFLVTTP
ncbi:hypothetical protein PYW08_012587 [Mythimna loreyi]|uniref:Uncharacterized protein n=1 Tax=Mythimna loreyi TaxID=667449 RepID=A0ACC2Q0S9_9NEOP|nr:hypothetical protein PYW08_012587 [Mythimna loreyi]